MTLSVSGDDLEISYLEVPPALRELGVVSGTPLVRGHWVGKVLNGEAFAFSPGCAPIAYPVRGMVDFAGSLLVIGPVPVSCADRTLVWNESAVIRFDPPKQTSSVRVKKRKDDKPKAQKPKPKPEAKRPVRRAPAPASPWMPQQQYQWRW